MRTNSVMGGRQRSLPPYRRRQRLAAILGGSAALVVALLLGLSLISHYSHARGSEDAVRLVPVTGVIDPLIADYIDRSLSEAEQDQVQAVILELDTPGGLDESMRQVVKKMTNSPLAVIVYVAPTGARAASAGTFICLAADVAAMAPGTNLGAAHPVAIGVGLGSEEGRKVTNDAAAYIRSLAEASGRDANWAELAVRQSVSLSADQALNQGIIEFKADSVESLLDQLDGYQTKAKGITLHTADAPVRETSMNFKERLLHLLINPNVAYLLLVVGLLALAYELVHPGIGLGAATGIIALILAFYALQLLPVNYAGLALVILGMSLLALELFLPSHGALSLGGLAALLTGSFILYDDSAPFLRVAWPLNLALAGLTAAFFLLVARAVVKSRRLPIRTGQNGMIGEEGVARTELDPLGQVFIHGEIWSAEAPEGVAIAKGERVEVTGIRGLVLLVRGSGAAAAELPTEEEVH